MDELSMLLLVALVFARLATQFEMALGRVDDDPESCCHHGDWGASAQTAMVRYTGGEEAPETQACGHLDREAMWVHEEGGKQYQKYRCRACGLYFDTTMLKSEARARLSGIEIGNAWGGSPPASQGGN